MNINYLINQPISVNEFKDILELSGLGERRPMEDEVRLQRMIENANLLVTAWDNTKLVGVARAISDFSYCTYLSDVAVAQKYQSKGIGKELIQKVRVEGGDAKLILLSAPKAKEYYPKLGFNKHDACYILP